MGVKVSQFPLTSTIEADDFIPMITAADSPTGTKRITIPNFLKSGNTVYVDGTNGIDAQGARGSLLAYKTCAAAKAAAQSGDTIVVWPGTYRESNLLKDGVNWHFFPGAKIYRTQADADTAPSIFDDSANGANAAIVCDITGWGEFYCDDTLINNQGIVVGDEENSLAAGILVTVHNASSRINIQCKGFYSPTTDAPNGCFFIWVKNCDKVSIIAEEAKLLTSGQFGICLWNEGQLHTHIKHVQMYHAGSTGGTYAFWASEPAAGAGGTDWYCECDLVDSHYSLVYFDGVGSSYRMWCVFKEARSTCDPVLGVNVDLGVFEVLNAGRIYITAEKILTRSAGAVLGPVVYQTGGDVWFTAQKFTAESSIAQTGGIPLFIQQSAGTSKYTVQQYEHVGVLAGNGVAMSGGTMELFGGVMGINNGKGIVHTGGTTRVSNMRIVTSTTNAAGNCGIDVGSSGVTISNIVIIAPALAFSLDASSAQNVLNTFSFSNRPYDAVNITFVGAGLFTDDPAWT